MHNKNSDILQFIFLKLFKCKEESIKKIKLNNHYSWDSISHLRLIIEIEKEFRIKVNPSIYEKLDSFEAILNYLNDK